MIRLTATCQMQRARPGSPRQPTSESTVPKKQIARRVRDPRICRLVQPPPPPQRHRHDPADRTGSRLLQSNPDSPRGCHPIARASTSPGGIQRSSRRTPQVSRATATWTCLWVSTPTITFRRGGCDGMLVVTLTLLRVEPITSWSDGDEFDGLIWPRGDGPSWPHLGGDVSGC